MELEGYSRNTADPTSGRYDLIDAVAWEYTEQYADKETQWYSRRQLQRYYEPLRLPDGIPRNVD